MWVQAAMALSSLASSYGEQKKQKAFLEEERRRQQQASDEAAERIDAATQKAGQPIRRAMAGQRVALSARDPFMEMAVQQGAYQQTAAETRKAELASGGIGAGGRVRGQAGARAAAAAQGLMSRESMRIQRQRELNQLIGQEAAQLGEITMAGMRTREQTVQGYQDRIGQLRQQEAAMPDFGAQALRGAVGAMVEGGAFEGMTGGDAFSGINEGITSGLQGLVGYTPAADPTVKQMIPLSAGGSPPPEGSWGSPLWGLFEPGDSDAESALGGGRRRLRHGLGLWGRWQK